jgi:hypothetical protein
VALEGLVLGRFGSGKRSCLWLPGVRFAELGTRFGTRFRAVVSILYPATQVASGRRATAGVGPPHRRTSLGRPGPSRGRRALRGCFERGGTGDLLSGTRRRARLRAPTSPPTFWLEAEKLWRLIAGMGEASCARSIERSSPVRIRGWEPSLCCGWRAPVEANVRSRDDPEPRRGIPADRGPPRRGGCHRSRSV